MHPRGWAGRGTGKGGEPRARRGACPLQGGVRGAPGARRGACPVGCPLTLPLAYFSAPHPPVPLPGGKGETKVILCKGLRPLHPRGWVGRGTGEGGDFYFISPGLPPPAPLRLNLYGAGSTLGKQFLSVMPKTFPFNNIIEKSSGGSGGLFQESPSVPRVPFVPHQFRTLLSPLRIPIILSTSWRISGRKRMTREAATTERMRTRRKLRQPEPSFSKRTSAA